MDDIVSRFVDNLLGRIHGPMNFRFLIQPLTASFFAIRDGSRDAREGNNPYFWSLFFDPLNRRHHLASGWKSVGKVFTIALILDSVYQFIQLRWFYPGEAIVTAFVLALIPYILLRGPVNRFMSYRRRHAHANGHDEPR